MIARAAALMGFLLLSSWASLAHASERLPPDRSPPDRSPPVGASGRPVLLAFGRETREVYRCMGLARSGSGPGADRGASHYTDLDCPAQLPQRVATLVWLSRVGGSGTVQSVAPPISAVVAPKR